MCLGENLLDFIFLVHEFFCTSKKPQCLIYLYLWNIPEEEIFWEIPSEVAAISKFNLNLYDFYFILFTIKIYYLEPACAAFSISPHSQKHNSKKCFACPLHPSHTHGRLWLKSEKGMKTMFWSGGTDFGSLVSGSNLSIGQFFHFQKWRKKCFFRVVPISLLVAQRMCGWLLGFAETKAVPLVKLKNNILPHI